MRGQLETAWCISSCEGRRERETTRMKRPLCLHLMIGMLSLSAADKVVAAPELTVHHDEAAKKVEVKVQGEPFGTLIYNTQPKPVTWPLYGAYGIRVTRDWPLKPDTPGEDHDHPHHQSVWFTHGAVNGVDFWAQKKDSGKIVTQKVERATVENGAAVIELRNAWQTAEGKTVATDTTTLRFGVEGEHRWVDYTITLVASEGDVVLGDTKEGTMAVRTRPELNLEKNALAAGQCVNSEGVTGKAVWGLSAKWVDYWAPVEGKVIGLALFDHPHNLRHPTTWHAREYGLVAANPFGLHDFSRGRLPAGSGDYTIKAGESQTWRYRLWLHAGDAKAADTAGAWERWAQQPVN